ncbi:MAG: glycosyltransferase family A protein [Chloroflexota bacterium]
MTAMNDELSVSVIIPTYNRKAALRACLHALSQQTWPSDRFEVIVVDDGSTDGTGQIVQETFPFAMRYLWQENQGDAAARNTGARHSQADLLIFIDDDILVEPGYVAGLAQAHLHHPNRIVIGTTQAQMVSGKRPLSAASFTDVCSNNMSLRREAYFEIGEMQALPFGGSDIWCDVDFAFRAYQQGFGFYRAAGAVCLDRDYGVQNTAAASRRMEETAYRAVFLFQQHPDLPPHIPMLHDKVPIRWGEDSPGLILRKLVRRFSSASAMVWAMEKSAQWLEKFSCAPILTERLYLWIRGSYMYRGYSRGLQDVQEGAR